MITDFNDLRVVVVESDLNMRNIVLKVLRDNGANRLEAFSSVTQAIPYLREMAVDIIIAEMEQTPIDGIGLAHALRSGKVKANTKTPLLLVTGSKDMEKIKDAIAAGANNIIVKPFSATDLTKRVKKTLGR